MLSVIVGILTFGIDGGPEIFGKEGGWMEGIRTVEFGFGKFLGVLKVVVCTGSCLCSVMLVNKPFLIICGMKFW